MASLPRHGTGGDDAIRAARKKGAMNFDGALRTFKFEVRNGRRALLIVIETNGVHAVGAGL